MREILFRGKQTYNGEWIYGYYIKATHHWHDYGIHEDWIATDAVQNGGWCNIQGKHAVIPETVGQYTGLSDKNGTRVFEGDILKIARVSDSIGSYYFPPLVYPVNVIVRWDMCAWIWETLCEDKRYIAFPDAWCHYECEVIGNIHDNAEILKGE